MHKNLLSIILVIVVLIIVAILLFPKKSNPVPKTNSQTLPGDSAATVQYMPLGDSYTIGEGVREQDRFPNQLTTRLREKGYSIELLNNPSRTGYTTLDLIERELPVLKNSNANLISLLIGVNDQVRGTDTETFRARFISVLDKVKATKPQARIFILTIPNYSLTPSGKKFGDSAKNTEELTVYNKIINEEARKKNIPVVDIWEISQSVSDTPSLTTEDGLHPSAKHYTLWADKILPTAESILR